MISIEVEVKINGQPVKVSGKLNDLVVWFITQQLVANTSVASFAPSAPAPAKTLKMSKSHRVPRPKFSDEEIQGIRDRAKQLQHLTQTQAINTLVAETKRSSGSIWKHLRTDIQSGQIKFQPA